MGEVYAMLYHTALHLLVLSLFYSTAAPPYCLHTILVGESPYSHVFSAFLSCSYFEFTKADRFRLLSPLPFLTIKSKLGKMG